MHKISYIGDGVTTEFFFEFPFFQHADVRVAINENILDTTQYDINENEKFDGGIVTFAAPPDEGARIDIFRQISLQRIIDYQPTAKIDPENLNDDFNFLLAAFKDLRAIDIDLAEWKNIHESVLGLIKVTTEMIMDKTSGGAALGLYSNLLSVLESALPNLINDYGSIAEQASNENRDDYGML